MAQIFDPLVGSKIKVCYIFQYKWNNLNHELNSEIIVCIYYGDFDIYN